MRTRDVLTGFLILVIVVSGILLFKKYKSNDLQEVPVSTPTVEERLSEKFVGLEIPDDADKTDLTDVSGGTGVGAAIRNFDSEGFGLTVIADIEDPEDGFFYQAWVNDGNGYLSLGRLTVVKGGYLVDFASSKDYSDYKEIVVTKEKTSDNTPETIILKGSF